MEELTHISLKILGEYVVCISQVMLLIKKVSKIKIKIPRVDPPKV